MKFFLRSFIFLLCLEIFLRLGGTVTIALQDYQNKKSIKNQKAYRILCIGESMTQGAEYPYPKQLEDILNRKKLSMGFHVMNKAVAGLTTDGILVSINHWIEEYKPNMVIAMMGLNDETFDPFQVQAWGNQDSHLGRVKMFLGQLRVYKLLRGIRKDFENSPYAKFVMPASKREKLAPKSEKYQLYEDIPNFAIGSSDENTEKAFQLGLMSLVEEKYSDAEQIFRILMENPKSKIHNSKLTFIHYLALCYYQEAKVSELMTIVKKLPFRDWRDIHVIDFCNHQEDAATVISALKDLNQEFPVISFYVDMISQCYERSGDAKQAGAWKEKALQMKGNQTNIKTKANYLTLVDILKGKNIVPVVMQYPLRDVESLKSMLRSSENYDRIIFIDNGPVFKEAVKKDGYAAIFSDYYAGDFGHPTIMGDQILAENVAQKLISAMNWN